MFVITFFVVNHWLFLILHTNPISKTFDHMFMSRVENVCLQEPLYPTRMQIFDLINSQGIIVGEILFFLPTVVQKLWQQ